MKSLCYCCDSEATTYEHVPPQCLFPERKDLPNGPDLRRNLITVPSCFDHNIRKSGDDEYLMYALTMNLPADKLGEHHFATKVWRAIERRPSLIKSLLATSSPVSVHDTATDQVVESSAIQIDEARLKRGLRQVALGLHRHHLGSAWQGSLTIYPEFLLFLQDANAQELNAMAQSMSQNADILFKDAEFFGENPEVFRYQLVLPDTRIPVAIRMHFYGGAKVLALFGAAGG